MRFDTLAQLLTSYPDSTLGSGATKEEIERAERDLGLRIFGTYREFLRRFGWGGVQDFELFGIGAGAPFHLDLVKITQSERTEMEPRLPSELLPIMNDGGGNLYCINTNTSSIEPAIVAWYHDLGSGQTPELVAEDFASWVAGLLTIE